MSIHVDLSDEAREKLRKQKTTSTVTSFLISISVIGILAVTLATLTILIPTKEVETIISYKAPPVEQEVNNKPIIQKQQRQTPTPPAASSAVANVITTASPSVVSIPDTNTLVDVESSDFGSSADFGMGFGFEQSTNSSTTFFGSEVSGARICYVIDYSLSMKGRREALMRAELSDSIEKLEGGAQFSLIFFSGATWQASDQVELGPSRSGNKQNFVRTVTAKDGTVIDWGGSSRINEKEFKKFKPYWVSPSKENIVEYTQYIKDTPLNMGTEWGKPLLKALEMTPQPEIIVFMTDGSTGGDPMAIVDQVSGIANKKSIVVNTISLMHPKAEAEMKALAENTGGSAKLVMSETEIIDLITGEKTTR